ncbi:SNF2-related protein [Spirosoma sp. KUDC1026]|uniref:SNF2-related protein n=1 Tax=Spirosoma sp. KUDC1026 TaxID=2745947 RepID=UPI00159BB38E|nr:SNF2-related protein [Spirosoma sp. KUDC1026]QKZ12961.1 DEAD/DEAH box helicase family protein [Spirosoma sp. KUDC1026]
MPSFTPYHAKYLAFELSKRSAADNLQKLASTLVDAQVDLNPHQVEAALFAFRSPLSKGAILADEVGLGKTIEAGLVISQKWAERKRKILVITPANLRKQWSQELMDKFFLPSTILEAKSFNDAIKARNLNPFDSSVVVLCSYQFASTKEAYVESINWDLVVIDEAHRLRNVYKSGSRIARSIKQSLTNAPKVLLTATPLQNSLLELYGLVSIIDDYTFGDLKSFKSQYSRVNGATDEAVFSELKERLKPVCKRTLRRQVLEYIRYTNRIALVEEFYPTSEEQQLYDLVSEYLQQDNLYALPASQRKLMTLILRRLLASSTYAISGTLGALVHKLEHIVETHTAEGTDDVLAESYEGYDELKDEWTDEEDGTEPPTFNEQDIAYIQTEIQALKRFEELAKSIQKNSKGEKLFTALQNGFDHLARLGAPRKAIIFTESTRTQEYLRSLLEANGHAGRVVLFNGANTDATSRRIYQQWLDRHRDTDRITGSRTADMRAALVEFFREEATIMIATEAAAEGINLQFCSLIINYDLPWNPQRIEQRIGRCHRYGQKYDVVVVNFLNKANAADQRVYQLLNEKFTLFNGVFGASDEVLGSIESGIDFEKRIAQIYQDCRTPAQIESAFNALQAELEGQISEAMQQTRRQLLENFDEEVHEKLRINLLESKEYLSRYETYLWNLTRYCLADHAHFADDAYAFNLQHNPFADVAVPLGAYRIGKNITDSHVYRVGHPLAQRILDHCRSFVLPVSALHFDYAGSPKRISALEPLLGQGGWLMARGLTVNAFEAEDHVLLAGLTDDGTALDPEQCHRLFSLTATQDKQAVVIPPVTQTLLSDTLIRQQNALLSEIGTRNEADFMLELDKLDKWGEDRRNSLKMALRDLDEQLKEIKKQIRLAPNLPEKLKLERERRRLDTERDAAWRQYDDAAKEIDRNKDQLIDEIEKKITQHVQEETLFCIRWQLN